MPIPAAPASGPATVAHAQPGSAAALDHTRAFADATLLRAAASLLGAQALAARMIADADRRARNAVPRRTQGPESDLRAPERVCTDTSYDAQPDAPSAQTGNAGNTCPLIGEVLCGL